jgi:murein DD-endopeptidase MepM/ murein hydrolase activator NlpD
MAEMRQKMDRLKHQMNLQSRSLDSITMMAKDKEMMLASIPSIKPIRSDKLNRTIKLLSGFGPRIHPIHKVRKMHWGIDFSAPSNTPIQATGAGKVTFSGRKSGYGNCVEIDHGYGYKTLYAHMSTIEVERGEEVVRGEMIGRVGSTGTSTAPHCHYEITLRGQKVDPIQYCLDGLTPGEYQELVELAAVQNQSFD